MKHPFTRLLYLLLLLLSNTYANSQTVSGFINSYYKVTEFVSTYNGVRLQSIAGLSVGDKVLLIQMKGAAITETNSAAFGSVSSIGSAGTYEFLTICGFLNDTVVFSDAVQNTYDVNAQVQLVSIPVFTNVTVTGTLRAGEWDPVAGTGGVLALEASGTVTLQADVSADSAGFKGGALFYNTTNRCLAQSNWFYSQTQSSSPNLGGSPKGEGIASFIASKEYGRGKQANGGGGANVDNTGGGGGANYGAGGQGGNKTNAGICVSSTPGQGGASLAAFGYSSSDNRVFMGGGGGCGEMNNVYSAPYPAGTPGGDGGGIIYLKCNTLVANSYRISANGAQGVNPGLPVPVEAAGDGGGGGGAGGTLLLDITSISGTLTAEARGADGSKAGFQTQCPGPGGGGGGGVIWSASALPGTVTTNVNGGAAGTIKEAPAHNPPCEFTANGAVAGGNGIILSGFSIPATSIFNCGVILSTGLWQRWQGVQKSVGVTLYWQLHPQLSIARLVVERSENGASFKPVFQQLYSFEAAQEWTDPSPLLLPASYRLVVTTTAQTTYTSHPLMFQPVRQHAITVFPNPVSHTLHLRLPLTVSSLVDVEIRSVTGRLFLSARQRPAAFAVMQLPVQFLPSGVYFVTCRWQKERVSTKFVKQ